MSDEGVATPDPSDPDQRGGDQFERGSELVRQGDLAGAERAYRRAAEQGDGAAAANLGVLLEHRGELAGAEEAYRAADERGSKRGAFRLGMLLSGREDWDAANAAWGRADEREADPGPDVALLLRRGGGEAPARVGAGGGRSAFASPVLVGAVTVLVVLVAVFLAYNANQGLPFLPTRELRVDLADGSNVVVGNDVLVGGSRVGLVSDMRPVVLSGGRVGAQLVLKLNRSQGSVPVDSTASVRLRSVLGLKFVQISRGSSSRVFGDGATMPVGQTSVPVQFDDVFKTFDPRTRNAIQQDLRGFGDTLTGRGSDLNDTIASLPGLLGHLTPVARYLSDPGTELTRFLDSLDAFMGAVAPVKGQLVGLFGEAATTFAAVDRSPADLQATIRESPSTLGVSTSSLRVQQPLLVDLRTLGTELAPGTGALVSALPNVNPALEAGTRTLIRTPSLDQKLQQVMDALRSLALEPGTNVALNALQGTVGTLNPMVRYLGPFVTVCNDWNYWWTYLSEHLSEQTSFGYAERALFNQGNPLQPNGVGVQGATAPVNGGVPDTPLGGNQFLHSQNYGAAIDNQGNADCETGQRGWPKKLNYFDPQGRNLGLDPHTPGDQGPTFTGRAHVPPGETFTRNPQTGPQLAPNPSNP